MTTRAERRGKIQSVLGLIDADRLGPTLMHEHLLCDITPPELAAQGLPDVEITLENCWEVRHHWCRHMGNNRLDDKAVAVAELRRLREAGGRCVVDLTCAGIKPDPLGLREISQAADVTIIAGCGYYVEAHLDPGLNDRSVDDLAAGMIGDVERGIGGTGVKAGIVGEIGASEPWTALERKTLRAAAIAQRETGASLNVHPGRRPESPSEIVGLVAAAGGDPARSIISHVDRTIFDQDTLFRLADTGCVIEYDFFGIESAFYPFQDIDLPNDATRLAAIRVLIDRGHLDQVLISQDICTKTRLTHYGGHGYGHIFDNVVPMMERKGFEAAEIKTILEHTPRRLLTLQ
jgi:phosphotriesterase-related protein